MSLTIVDILKSDEYKKLLIQSFEYGKIIKFGDFFSKKNIKPLEKMIKSQDVNDRAYRIIKIYENVEFCMNINDKFIGVFNNKYIVLFDEGNLDFEFIGDTVSNWVQFAGSEIYKKEIKSFQLLCYQQFNTPITVFDPYNNDIEKEIYSLFK